MFLTVNCCQILHGVPVAAGLLLLLPAHLHPQRALHLSPAGESRDRGNLFKLVILKFKLHLYKVNLSLVWVVLVLIFTYKLLLSLNGLYFEVI